MVEQAGLASEPGGVPESSELETFVTVAAARLDVRCGPHLGHCILVTA